MMLSRAVTSSESSITAPSAFVPRIFGGLSRLRGKSPAVRRGSSVDLVARPLVDVEPGKAVRITAVNLETGLVDWLRAVGIEQGGSITVLRRAVFGGPIHLRCSSGGEFALDKALARVIVTRADADARAA